MTGPTHYCSFCSKSESEVFVIITADATNSPAICDECVELCRDLVEKRRAKIALDLIEGALNLLKEDDLRTVYSTLKGLAAIAAKAKG